MDSSSRDDHGSYILDRQAILRFVIPSTDDEPSVSMERAPVLEDMDNVVAHKNV